MVQSEEPEVVDMREFRKLNVSLLDGRSYTLKMFEQQAEWKDIERPREKNILGKSIEALKLELNAEKISKHVRNFEICLLFYDFRSFYRRSFFFY